jgi:hypothetical protein
MSLIRYAPPTAAANVGTRRRRIAVALHERPLDVMPRDEVSDRLSNDRRHRYGFDQIVAGIG